MLIDDAPVSTVWRRAGGTHAVATAATVAVVAAMVVLQVVASRSGFEGPLQSLAHDFAGTPKSMSVPWAGLALGLVGLTNRQRVVAVAAAVGIDLVVLAGRLIAGSGVAAGTGPTWVLAGIAVVAAVRWTGERRAGALLGVGLGALLIAATKIGDVWLQITVMARPAVLDQYVELADRALGSPSWVMGQVVDAVGPAGYGVLHWVYIELPVAAIVVALYQVRGGWPAHHLVRTFLAIGLIGPLFYLLFPVVGPDFAFGAAGEGAQLGTYWPTTVPTFTDPVSFVFDNAAPRNCMPSLHTAWALAIFVHSRRGPLWLRWGGTFWLVCTLTATLGFGYHYGVDLVAGVVLSLTIESALRDPERGWGRFRIRLVVGGAVAFAALLASYRYLAEPIAAVPLVSAPLILGVMGAVVVAFHATFFAAPDSALGRWGGRDADTTAVAVG
ncbi:phosphatase PAP2 family protein [Rhodococcus olei]|uniref:Phosphatase PAP2 family protein n=1 Tax=Rhodococcus olei TaxID=2161675 RepID=A0ABP8PFV6_9NOCA